MHPGIYEFYAAGELILRNRKRVEGTSRSRHDLHSLHKLNFEKPIKNIRHRTQMFFPDDFDEKKISRKLSDVLQIIAFRAMCRTTVEDGGSPARNAGGL